jgi:tetratricopeptide (TPR) repeat protein
VREQHDDLFALVPEDPAEAARRLEPLVERYPHVGELYNLLAAALSGLGRYEEAERVIELNYDRNPKYLFARMNFAHLCISRGEVDRVPEISPRGWT